MSILSFSCINRVPVQDKWFITDVITNYKEKGPLDKFELPPKEIFIDKNVIINNGKIIFSKELSKTILQNDTFKITNSYTLLRAQDDEQSFMFPGSELSCLDDNTKKDTCYIRDSFLAILNIKSDSIVVYKLWSNSSNSIHYKLIVLEREKRLAFISENDFFILILEKE